MRLSELSTDRAVDVLCELTPYVSSIASDEDLLATAGKIINVDAGMNRYGYILVFVERLGEIIPILLKTHRADVYGILSVVNEKPVEEIARQNVMETMGQARELFQDRALMDFFRSFTRQGQTAPSVPSGKPPASA